MTTKALASELGATRSRQRPLVQQLSSGSIVTASTSTLSSPRILPVVPKLICNQTSIDSSTGTKTGGCPVCGRGGIHVVNATGLLHIHGPHKNRCKGSGSRPLAGFQHATSSQSHSTRVDLSAEIPPSVVNSTSTPSDVDAVNHPPRNLHILKRIPKGARPAATNLLQKLINDVVLHPMSSESWSKLFGFSSACFVKPLRGGKSRNLTTSIVKQIREYDLESEPHFGSPLHTNMNRRNNSSKSADEAIARIASTKLEDGDVKGAVRLLCSDDAVATEDMETFNTLCNLHPPAPTDRRQVPLTTASPLQVLPAAVRVSIQSFPNGSAAGPDGLRPQHLKDLLLGCADDSSLLEVITDLINLLLAGKVPTSVRGAIFGANLLAITKKSGGIRPIAVGYVWRRLAAKVACSHVKDASVAILTPRQLGFGVRNGAEAAVRAARCYLENMESGQVFMKIDFKNAFNMLRRDSILEAVAKHFPELLHFTSSTIASSSALQFGEFTLMSEEGAQQGDPLGPLYFCLVFKELLDSMCSELVLGYLDDVAMGDTAEIVLRDFIHLETVAAQLGLEINRSKCEVVGHTDESRSLFEAHGVILPESENSTIILLGAPLSSGQHLDNMLEGMRIDLQRLSRRLEWMPSHDSLYLLRNVFTAPRLMYLLRTACCSDSPVLPLLDATIRDSLSAILNVDLDEKRWLQASLPVRWGGLGVRSVVSLAPSAYLASAACTAELKSTLLPAHLRDVDDSGVAVSLPVWKRHSSSPPPSSPSSLAQRNWDDPCCEYASRYTLKLFHRLHRPSTSCRFVLVGIR